MPPRSSLTSSFSISDSTNEVVCPLRNQDGSNCRKRCLGEKRFRSMQEHIRRAHPEYYISKLPATEESFLLMINTPPSDRSQTQQNSVATPNNNRAGPVNINDSGRGPYSQDRGGSYLRDDPGLQHDMSRSHDDYGHNGPGPGLPAATSAAAALAQLHHTHQAEGGEWDGNEDWHSDSEGRRMAARSTIELPPIHMEPTSDPYPPLGLTGGIQHHHHHHHQQYGNSSSTSNHNNNNNGGAPRHGDLLPSILSTSPPAGRSSTLPPLQRPLGASNRPRKQSITKSRHKKQRSRGTASDWLRRLQNDNLRPGGINDRKAHSVEPGSDNGRRWEDLVDAAASATEDLEDDRTPVSWKTYYHLSLLTNQVPQSPISVRASLPPLSSHQHPAFPQGYQASPLQQQALTPPSFAHEAPEPFPSVESGESAGSGDNFHMGAHGLSHSSPVFPSSHDVHIYCAACQKASRLRDSYACVECICGICRDCVNVLMEEQGDRRKCPRCATINGRLKPFQLDIR